MRITKNLSKGIVLALAIKGPSVMLDFHEQMSRKISFADAFQNIFGTTWQSAQPELTKVIYDRYLHNY